MAAQILLVLLACLLRIKAEGEAGSEEEGGYTAPTAPLPYTRGPLPLGSLQSPWVLPNSQPSFYQQQARASEQPLGYGAGQGLGAQNISPLGALGGGHGLGGYGLGGHGFGGHGLGGFGLGGHGYGGFGGLGGYGGLGGLGFGGRGYGGGFGGYGGYGGGGYGGYGLGGLGVLGGYGAGLAGAYGGGQGGGY